MGNTTRYKTFIDIYISEPKNDLVIGSEDLDILNVHHLKGLGRGYLVFR